MHLERLALILEVVSQKGRATVADICVQSDLPKPTAYRLVKDLLSSGLLESPTRGEFAIGTRLKRITLNDHSDPALLELIAPVLARAAANYGATFFLSRLRSRSVEIIHVETPQSGTSYLHPGLGKRPLHACSSSKVIAAFSPELLSECELIGNLKSYTEHTLTRPDELKAEFEVIRRRGYAECVEEIERGICSVAAPLAQAGPGKTISIGSTGSSRVFTSTHRQSAGQTIIELASSLSTTLGWERPKTV